MHEEVVPPVWYKQFWPWFIIALPSTVVVASLFTVYIAFTNQDPMVDDNYYKKGMAINRMVEDLEKAVELKLEAVATIVDNQLVLEFEPVDALMQDKQIKMDLKHPLNESMDVHLVLQQTDATDKVRYEVVLPEMEYGRWYVDVYSMAETPWRIKSEMMFPLKQFSLRASSDG